MFVSISWAILMTLHHSARHVCNPCIFTSSTLSQVHNNSTCFVDLCEGMLQGHSVIWCLIHIQISSLIYTSVWLHGCKASVGLLGNKGCKNHGEMTVRACRWNKTKDVKWVITPSFLIAVIQTFATFTSTALSKWHKYLISTHSNVLMIDFLTQVAIQVTRHKSEWMRSSALHWSVHLTPKNIQFHTSYWILRGCNKPLVWLSVFCLPRKLLIWVTNGCRMIETIVLISLITFAVPSVWENWLKGF